MLALPGVSAHAARGPLADEEPGAGADSETIQSEADEPTVTVSETGLIDLHVRETPISAILEMLSYESRASIVATTSVSGKVSANLYGVTLDTALEAILTPEQFVYFRKGKIVYVGTPSEMAVHLPPPGTRIFRLKYLTRGEAAKAIRALLSPIGSVVGDEPPDLAAQGGGAGMPKTLQSETSSDYLIVTDVPEVLEQMEAMLDELDVRPKQVLIEATILRATLNEDNQLGIDFTLLGGVDFQNVNSTSDPAAMNLALGPLPPDDLQKTTFNVQTSVIGDFPASGFTFGIVKDSVAVFVRAMEAVTDVTVVANPKIIALNKQNGEVTVGRRDGYVTTTVTETAAIQTIEFLETGTQIKFTPIINDDGTVRLEVHPKDSNGGLTADNLPFEETTEAHAQLVIEDGHTVLIGGLFRERTVSSRTQVPVLGDVPLLGPLFQSKFDQTVREEVVILLTVHILNNTQEESDRFAALLEDAERIRVGTRKGLMGWGRERLAQAFYQEAVHQTEQGDFDRALLNVRMALHNHPRHAPASKLKEQLLSERAWDSDGTRTRAFLLELLRSDRERAGGTLDPETYGRPALEWDVLGDELSDLIPEDEE